jgi:uncharacterized protein YvpB
MRPRWLLLAVLAALAGSGLGTGLIAPAALSHTAAAAGGPFPAQYVTVAPQRILDTRSGNGAPRAALGPNAQMFLAVAGRGGLPRDSVSAVVLNLTVTQATDSSFLTVFPSDASRPQASNINFVPGQDLANLVTVALGADGSVGIYNAAGQVDVVADVEGYYVPLHNSSGLFRPLPPSRIVDTRTGNGGYQSPIAGGSHIDFPVAGRGGVPSTGAGAVALNITATGSSEGSYLTVFPTGSAMPGSSTVNFPRGGDVPNRTVAKLGTGGRISIFNATGAANVVVDVAGWFTDGSDGSAAGGAFTGMAPVRILDTRSGNGTSVQRLAGTNTLALQVAGRGAPSSGAGSVVLNMTVTGPSDGSFLTVYPSGGWVPLASDLNFTTLQTVANLAITKLGADGQLVIYNAVGLTAVVADLAGYYSDAPSQGSPPGAPTVTGAQAVSRSQVSVSWSPPSDPGSGSLSGYTVIAQPGSRQWPVDAGATSAVAGGLQCGGTYNFQVAAHNVGGGSGPASAASGPVTLSCPTSNVIGGVPWIRQIYALSCEAAALQMVLAFQGINVNQDQILNAIGIDWRAAYYDSSGLRWGNPYTNFVGNPSGSESNLTGYGTYHTAISRVATQFGGRVRRAGEGISPQEVYDAILEGHPVVAWVTWDWAYHGRSDYIAFDGQRVLYAGPVEHALTVIGVTPDSVLINDPDRNTYWLPRSTFEASYASYNNMAVIMT